MLQRLLFNISYFFFWMVYFLIAKLVFLVYHYPGTAELPFAEILQILLYGLRLDASFTAYLSLLPFVIIAFSVFLSGRLVKTILSSLSWFFLALVSLMVVLDLELFRMWGFRLDTTPLMYLNSPGEMWASAAASPIWLLAVVFVALLSISGIALMKKIIAQVQHFKPVHPLFYRLFSFVVLLALTAVLIIPLRGGLQLAPVNQASVYFSKHHFANQAAVNAPWNFFHAVTEKEYDRKNPYQFTEPAQAQNRVKPLFEADILQNTARLLKTKRPNIILIIWESLTAKAVGYHGRVKGVTPQLDSLIREGVYFENFYANGNRSDKGLMAILSAYPAQPTRSIITVPKKTQNLPSLSRVLSAQGYRNAFYYGGELEFANIRSYVSVGNYAQVVSKPDFDSKDWNSKWGAHDHVVFNRLLADTPDGEDNFFKVFFTLSSHEPFEVPVTNQPDFGAAQFNNPALSAEDVLFLKSHHYTDASLGDFIAAAKKRAWWKETLIIIVADHGHLLPFLGNNNHFDKQNFQIPMLWLGGALAVSDTVIHKTGSQTDIAPTLLAQLDINPREFVWGKNLLHPQSREFAHYVFNDGLGFVSPGQYFLYDNVAQKVMIRKGDIPALDTARALLQMTYQDYLDR